jgi:hypothetical protein
MANLSHIKVAAYRESSASLSVCTSATFIATAASSLGRWFVGLRGKYANKRPV